MGLKKVDNLTGIVVFPNSLCIITFSPFAYFTEMTHNAALGQHEFLRMNKQVRMVVSPPSSELVSFVGCLFRSGISHLYTDETNPRGGQKYQVSQNIPSLVGFTQWTCATELTLEVKPVLKPCWG